MSQGATSASKMQYYSICLYSQQFPEYSSGKWCGILMQGYFLMKVAQCLQKMKHNFPKADRDKIQIRIRVPWFPLLLLNCRGLFLCFFVFFPYFMLGLMWKSHANTIENFKKYTSSRTNKRWFQVESCHCLVDFPIMTTTSPSFLAPFFSFILPVTEHPWSWAMTLVQWHSKCYKRLWEMYMLISQPI